MPPPAKRGAAESFACPWISPAPDARSAGRQNRSANLSTRAIVFGKDSKRHLPARDYTARAYINVVALKQSYAIVGSWRADFSRWKTKPQKNHGFRRFSVLKVLKTRWHRDCTQAICCAEN
jgi:hypothetical protein